MRRFFRKTLIEQLASQCGWRVVEREGDAYRIRPDDDSPVRFLHVRCRGDSPFVTFTAVSALRLPLASLTLELARGLLLRNHELFFGLWGFDVTGPFELVPFLSHTAIKAGLCPAGFATIRREMDGEREAVHRLLRAKLAEFGHGTELRRQ